MSDEPAIADCWEPGPALPDPTTATGPTRWIEPATDYAPRADGSSSWADVPKPAAVPPGIAEGPQSRPGWLARRRPVCGDAA